MQSSGQRASRMNSATIDRVEAALLAPLVGSRLDAVVIETRGERVSVQIADPPVTATAPAPPDARAGARISLLLVRTDIATGEVEFAL